MFPDGPDHAARPCRWHQEPDAPVVEQFHDLARVELAVQRQQVDLHAVPSALVQQACHQGSLLVPAGC